MKATFDPSKNLDLYFRKNRAGTVTLVFKDADGNDYSLAGLTFVVLAGFVLGAEVSGNEIELSFDEETEIKRSSYFWELYNEVHKKTWLCGTAHFTEGLSAQATDTVEITINPEGESVEVTIAEVSGNNFRGPYDASSGDYPTDPTISDGDFLRVSVAGILEITGIGPVAVNPGALLFALTDNPGNEPDNWKVLQ
jgi:hypothetical protein